MQVTVLPLVDSVQVPDMVLSPIPNLRLAGRVLFSSKLNTQVVMDFTTTLFPSLQTIFRLGISDDTSGETADFMFSGADGKAPSEVVTNLSPTDDPVVGMFLQLSFGVAVPFPMIVATGDTVDPDTAQVIPTSGTAYKLF